MKKPQKVLVTGPTGFIGRKLCADLRRRGYKVMAALHRQPDDGMQRGLTDESVVVGNIEAATDWSRALEGVDSIAHLAARVHVMREHVTDPLAAYRAVNTFGTAHLARSAAAAGVRRLVFVSSIKVNGETTTVKPFTAHDQPGPMDAYATSKWEAEKALQQIGRETGLEVVIVRPPLVYGPGVKGNYLRLLRMVKRGIPMPFGSCNNKRSFVYLDNIVDLLVLCLTHAQASGHTFLVSDDEDLSTAELVTLLARTMETKPRLISMPPAWLEAAAKLVGKPGIYERLCGSLQLDIRHTCQHLQWAPPVSAEEGIARTARWFLDRSGQP
jgi:UDP-glucose 4-epimerase